MSDRKRILFFSILVMACGMFCTAAVTIAILYQTTLEDEREELIEIARGQARFMEAVARFDGTHSRDDHLNGAKAATLSQITAAHKHSVGFGETGELVVAQREGDGIVFLFPYRHGDGSNPDPIPWKSELAEPMRRALSGEKGAVIGLDYRGERVLAAYHPVEVLNLGVVAKSDLAEIRAPFVVASTVAGGVTVLLVLVGMWLTLRVIDSLLRRFGLFQRLAEESGHGLAMADLNRRITYANPALCRMLGVDRPEDVLGRPFDPFYPEEVRRRVNEEIIPTVLEEGQWKGELAQLSTKGQESPTLENIFLVRDENGKPLCIADVVTDISERKRAEEALKESESKFRMLYDSTSDAVMLLNEEGFLDCNLATLEIFGCVTRDEFCGKHPGDLSPPTQPCGTESLALADRRISTALEKGTNRFEWIHKRTDGTEFPAEVLLNAMTLGGRPILQAVVRDITDRTRAEAELQRNSRLLAAINKVFQEAMVCNTEEEVASACLAVAEELTGSKFGFVGEVNQMGKFDTLALSDPGWDACKTPRSEATASIRDMEIRGCWGRALLEEESQIINDPATHPDRVGTPQGHPPLTCLLGVPVMHGNSAIGMIALANKDGGYDCADREDVERLSQAFAAALAHKRDERALGEARAAAEAANKAKSEFLANMSHEIRTPMTAILGFTDILLEGGDLDKAPPERLEAAETIKRNGDYLLRLIDDILNLSKYEAGKMTIERSACSLQLLVNDVASLMKLRADAEGLAFDNEYIGAIPETIETDSTRLRQTLINLIANAIKFTEVGGVRLVTRFVRGGDEPMVQFDVADTGIGMTPEQVAVLFQPFTQADASTTRRFGGTGLGLAISKRCAEMLGGDIAVVETQEGIGTRFRVTVAAGSLDGVRMIEDPISVAHVPVEVAEATERADERDLYDRRVLVAEDNPTNRVLVVGLLKKAGMRVTAAENGKLAADAALAARDKDEPFDVILMDIQMPVLGGYEATALLRKKGYPGPIIALTAHAMEGDREKCMEAGCDDYITKPIDRKKLIETIHQHLVPAESASSEAT